MEHGKFPEGLAYATEALAMPEIQKATLLPVQSIFFSLKSFFLASLGKSEEAKYLAIGTLKHLENRRQIAGNADWMSFLYKSFCIEAIGDLNPALEHVAHAEKYAPLPFVTACKARIARKISALAGPVTAPPSSKPLEQNSAGSRFEVGSDESVTYKGVLALTVQPLFLPCSNSFRVALFLQSHAKKKRWICVTPCPRLALS